MMLGTLAFSAFSLFGSAVVPSPSSLGPVEGFVRNDGQFDPQSEFLLRRPGLNVWVTESGAVYDYYRLDRTPRLINGNAEQPTFDETRTGDVVRVSIENAQNSGRAVGVHRVSAIENYFVGDKSRYAVGVPQFEEARVEDVTKGVSMRFYVENNSPRYDVIVKPSVSAESVRLRYEGARNLQVGADGSLQYETRFGKVLETGLLAYQIVGGVARRVEAKFLVEGNRVGFDLGSYNKDLPVVIDPKVITRATYLGGSSNDSGRDVAVSPSGRAYVSGVSSSDSTTFPASAGAYQTVNNGGTADWFVAALTPDLSGLTFRTFIGTNAAEDVGQIEFTAGGGLLFAGQTSGSGLPTTAGAVKSAPQGNDVYLTRISPELGTLSPGTYFGGTASDTFWEFRVTQGGSLVICGNAGGPSFPAVGAGADSTQSGASDAFVAVISGNFTTINMSTRFGGTGTETARAVALGARGAIYIGGHTTSSDIGSAYGFAGATMYQSAIAGTRDCFVARIEGKSGTVEGVTFFGSSSSTEEEANAIAITANNNVVFASRINGFVEAPGGFRSTQPGSTDGYIGMLNASLTKLVRGTYLGGSDAEDIKALALLPSGTVVVTGWTQSDTAAITPFPIVAGTFTTTPGRNGYIAHVSSNFSTLVSSLTFGGTDNEEPRAITLAGRYHDAYVTGDCGAAFPATVGAYDTTYSSGTDAFLVIAAQASDPVRVEFSANPAAGGTTIYGKVVLNAPAPVGGMTAAVTVSDAAVVAIPATFTIAAGETQKSFKLVLPTVGSPSSVLVSVTASGSTVSGTLNYGP